MRYQCQCVRSYSYCSFLSVLLGGPLDLMSRRVVAAGTREIADYVVKQLLPINYGRDDSEPDALA